MTASIIIPARYESVRFPGKPLAHLKLKNGKSKPLIQLSWEAAKRVKGINNIFVATDNFEIKRTAESFGAEVVMTSSKCENGTARCAEAVRIKGINDDIIINFQGDDPLTPKSFVEILVSTMNSDKTIQVSTPILQCNKNHFSKLINDRKNDRVGATTVVFDHNNDALYFSKEVIPYIGSKKIFTANLRPVYHHVGVYAYRNKILKQYGSWNESHLEKLEGLEQLRFLVQGKKIRCVLIKDPSLPFWELNNPSDKKIIEKMLDQLNVK